jgi:hypothetical protein
MDSMLGRPRRGALLVLGLLALSGCSDASPAVSATPSLTASPTPDVPLLGPKSYLLPSVSAGDYTSTGAVPITAAEFAEAANVFSGSKAAAAITAELKNEGFESGASITLAPASDKATFGRLASQALEFSSSAGAAQFYTSEVARLHIVVVSGGRISVLSAGPREHLEELQILVQTLPTGTEGKNATGYLAVGRRGRVIMLLFAQPYTSDLDGFNELLYLQQQTLVNVPA